MTVLKLFLQLITMAMMLASVTSLMVKNDLGTCLSYRNNVGVPKTGSFVVTTHCDPLDYKQINWVVNSLNVSSLGPVVQFCINQTNYCAGIEKTANGKYDNVNLKLVANDEKDTTQQWISLQSSGQMVGHFVNGKTGGCAQAYGRRRKGGVINTVNCRRSQGQEFKIVVST